MFCKECGTQLSDNAQFCTNCGAKTENAVSVESAGSSPPKKKKSMIIGAVGILVFAMTAGVFFVVKNQTAKNTDDEVSAQETVQHEDVQKEPGAILNAGTYVNELDSITIAKDVSGHYSFNMTGYDESGDFMLFSGSIDDNNGEYSGTISDDGSGQFINKIFSIMPADDSIMISSDDEALLFLCVQYQYLSEVDALEEDVSEYEENIIPDVNNAGSSIPLKEGYYGYWDNDTRYMLAINSDGTFTINVTGASLPVLYGEGEFHDNGDGTYKADITVCDDDFMRNQTIDISVVDENSLLLSAQYVQLNNAVQGTYQYAGSAPSDVEALRFNGADGMPYDSDIPYLSTSLDFIGMDFDVFVENQNYRHIKEDDIAGIQDLDLDYINQNGVILYTCLNDHTEIVGVKDNRVVIYLPYISESSMLCDVVPLEELEKPYICIGSDNGWSAGNLIWQCTNGYFILRVQTKDPAKIISGQCRIPVGRACQFFEDMQYSILYTEGTSIDLTDYE